MEFLTVDDVIRLHAHVITITGGRAILRDSGLLESAVAMPTMTYEGKFLHADIFEQAAAYLFHIAENQPFVNGNTRTAVAAGLIFLSMNGIDIDESADAQLYETMKAIANKQLERKEIADVLRNLLR